MLDGAMHSLEKGEADEARAILESALAQQRATIRELRDLSFVLEPVVLRDHGFGPALRALADQVAASHELVCEVDTQRATGIGETASIALYTILRELVDQAVRRGPPRRIAIAVLQEPDGQLLASVADDADPRAPDALARADRGACAAASRNARGRGHGVGDGDPRDAACAHGPPLAFRNGRGERHRPQISPVCLVASRATSCANATASPRRSEPSSTTTATASRSSRWAPPRSPATRVVASTRSGPTPNPAPPRRVDSLP